MSRTRLKLPRKCRGKVQPGIDKFSTLWLFPFNAQLPVSRSSYLFPMKGLKLGELVYRRYNEYGHGILFPRLALAQQILSSLHQKLLVRLLLPFRGDFLFNLHAIVTALIIQEGEKKKEFSYKVTVFARKLIKRVTLLFTNHCLG